MLHNLKIQLPVSILKEGKAYIAYSPALDLSTAGATFDEAVKHFDEAVQIFFEEIDEMGTLDEVMEELGWEKQKNQWNPPVVVSHEMRPVTFSYA